MKPFALILCGLSLWAFSVGRAEDLIFSTPGPDGSQLGFHVTPAQWERAPKWAFDGKTPPPLPFPEAYAKARASIRKRYPDVKDAEIYRYSLNRFNHPDRPDQWYYTFDFLAVIPGAGSVRYRRGLTAVILMDGTVVEPRKVTLKR